MRRDPTSLMMRLLLTCGILTAVLLLVGLAGLAAGSSGIKFAALWQAITSPESADTMLKAIIWKIRLPRVFMAIVAGATLSLGGLVFQALLRNPLAEPYILGVSGGAAIGAILGILLGFARFPGITLTAFVGSAGTLLAVLAIAGGRSLVDRDSLLLSGVMINAFCSAVIMFLVSLTQDSRLHSIMFWLMGDLSMAGMKEAGVLAGMVLPCFILTFLLSNRMNLLLLGGETAQTMGVNIRLVVIALLVSTSFMVSVTVSYCGLFGFVGLVIPHLLRLAIGPDHRVLVPACILGGGAFMVVCDILARTLPDQGEMPVGVITALVGAPLFIYLLKRSQR
jgi:iron complex transport system permease protein